MDDSRWWLDGVWWWIRSSKASGWKSGGMPDGTWSANGLGPVGWFLGVFGCLFCGEILFGMRNLISLLASFTMVMSLRGGIWLNVISSILYAVSGFMGLVEMQGITDGAILFSLGFFVVSQALALLGNAFMIKLKTERKNKSNDDTATPGD